MKMMVALSLLLTIAGCSNNNGVAAFVPRPVTTATTRTTRTTTASSPLPSRAATSDPNRPPRRRHVEVASRWRSDDDDDHHRVAGETDRRVALARLLATSASLVALPAAAADAATTATEFSESPTSDASIARSKYDGKGLIPSPPPPPAADPPAEPKPRSDFDGNEAGSVGAGDEGTKAVVKGAVMAKSTSPPASSGGKLDPKVSIPVSSEKLLGGAVVFFGLMALANGDDGESEADGATTTTSSSSSSPPPSPSPPADPYGLVGGRNFWDGVDMQAARSAGLVVLSDSPPPPAPMAVAAAVVAEPVAAAAATEGAKPKWKLEKPVPYGIQNANGRNPFITEVLEYCEGGKVTEDCADSIKGYLDNLADTGAAATTEDVTAIVGYLDSLGPDGPSPAATTTGKRRVGAAFATYLDALSAGSAPPPSSARAVKTYLDTLNGTAGAARSAQVQEGAASGPALPAGTVKLAPDFARYDDRLTGIEGRVAILETKVDELPDRVFEKIEAWQTRQEGRLAEEVRKIVNTLTSALPAAVESSPPPAPVAAADPPTPAPVPPAAAVVPASPLAGAIPERPGVPRAGAAPGPRKGYRFGGGSTWKSDDKPKAVMSSIPAPAAAAPVVQHTPLAGAIPERNVLPRAGASAPSLRSSVPKKFAVGGGGASWKTGKPKGGGGYLDNMSP